MSSENESNGSRNGGVFTWFLATSVLAVMALVVGVIALFSPGAEGSSSGSGGGSETIEVTLGEMYIETSLSEVPAGSTVTFEVTNAGTMDHDFMVDGTTGTEMLAPGESETFEYGPVDAPITAWCTVPGHKEAGMETTISIVGGSDGSVTHPDHASEADSGDYAEIDHNGEPSPDWVPRDPKLEPAPEGTVHEVTFNMTDKVMEVAPGVTQTLWTFEDQVPGPILHGKLGDTFRVTIVNKTEMDHSIDFHASEVAWNDEMRSIGPGEELVYEFTAEYAGVWMYHCGTAPTLHHIGNGMYGAVVIDPPDLAPVDHEFLMVQSEFYFGPEGGIGDLTKMQNDDWDAVVFNGYFNQYNFSPIEVGVGDRVRVWVIDDGPSENSSFHIVGTIFDTVFKEGAYKLRPDASRGGSQALDLQPAQGGFVEFDLAEEGYYPMVTHKFSNVGKGAAGLFKAGDPPPLDGGGH